MFREDLQLTDRFNCCTTESQYQRTQPKTQRLARHIYPTESVSRLRPLEIEEPPSSITRVWLPSFVSSIPPKAETDAESGKCGCEVACEGFTFGEVQEREEGDVGW